MSTRKPKYPSTIAGYLAYLFDTGATFTINPDNPQAIMVVANYDGHNNYITFLLDKPYTDAVADLKKHITHRKYTIVNARMY